MSAIRALTDRIKQRNLYDGDECSNLSDVVAYFSQYPGGSIDLYKGENNIATVTINNPSKKNAMSGSMMADFLGVVRELEDWKEGKGVILKGSGGNFCSGGDLNLARNTGCAEDGYRMATLMDNILTRFSILPFITVALIEGCGALGGGAEVSVACDFRLLSSDCQGIGFVHGRMGIITAWGGAKRLTRAVGYRQALNIISTAKIYSPSELLEIGLADEVIPTSCDRTEYAETWLQSRTSCSTDAVQGLKLQAILAHDSPEHSDLNNRLFAPYWGCSDNKKALASKIKHIKTEESK